MIFVLYFFLCCCQNEVTHLRNEVAQLKQLLLAHKDCPVTIMQKKAALLGNKWDNELTIRLLVLCHLCQDSSVTSSHLMHYFYSLTSLRVNVALSVCSCRRRGNLQGYFHWTHRLPGGSHSARAVALGNKSGGHHQRAERAGCRGGGHVRLGRHGIGPGCRGCHGNAAAVRPEMIRRHLIDQNELEWHSEVGLVQRLLKRGTCPQIPLPFQPTPQN